MSTRNPSQTQSQSHIQEQSIRDIQHFGEEGGVVPVIDLASTSTFLNPADMERVFQGELGGCYLYSRHSNPTVAAFGKKMAAMEGMEAALGLSSGMAAITCAIEQSMPEGGHLISSRTVYGGTYALLANLLPRRGIEVTFVDPDRPEEIEKAIRPDTKVIYTESVSNPMLSISNLRALGDIAKNHKVKLIVDNTFAPLIISPAKFGADIVVYSCTKYISGASDMIAGAVISNAEFINSLVDLNTGVAMLTGPVMDPRVAHELYLRLDHLPLRMRAHSEVAADLAQSMKDEGVKVIYPGLKDHGQYDLMTTMMNRGFGYGGMITIDCKTPDNAMRLASRLQDEKFGLYAVSLGFSRTLMSCPALSTSSEIPQEEQNKIGLSPGLLRLSIGFCGDSEVMKQRFFRCYREIFRG
jgi:methionine-gamma-lyase